ILGHPVRHSLSPAIHNAAFRAVGLNAVYLAFDVTDLPGALEGIRALGLKGLSVTIPHKESIIPLLDQVDPSARAIGAVNTVINRAGVLAGANTDMTGAVNALEDVVSLERKSVLVLGAGGAARAVCAGLKSKGADVHIANRTADRARQIAETFGASWSGLKDLEEVHAAVLVNTTSVGMYPDENEIPMAPDLLGRFEVVMDIVYSPLETRLLKEAAGAGCTTVNGLRMLLYQAVVQFEMWTSIDAPVEAMEKVLRDAVKEADA
ncbi:MAG TPA: shikimate dehydrogenase, partial [Thermodesulfobacteriaceae bacterium]|nr:shikimate dehydrogenase [Thermodesulfobacteriaceae bacterium]